MLLLLLGTWILRYDTSSKQNDIEIYIDRWANQGWTKVINANTYYEYPVLDQSSIDQEAYRIVKQDPDKSLQLTGLDERLTQSHALMLSNAPANQRYNELYRYAEYRYYRQQSGSDGPFERKAISSNKEEYIINQIPKEVVDGNNVYFDAEKRYKNFSTQKDELLTPYRSDAKQALLEKAYSRRSFLTSVTIAVATTCLLLLVYSFIATGKKRPGGGIENPKEERR